MVLHNLYGLRDTIHNRMFVAVVDYASESLNIILAMAIMVFVGLYFNW